MFIAILILVLLAVAWCREQAVLYASETCAEIRVRKEYRDMTAQEWNDYLRAMRLVEPELGRWTRIHLENVSQAHGVAGFFPWHRLFVIAWEERLRELVPGVTVPYWDWSADWADPLSASLFQLIPVRPGPNGDCRYMRDVPNRHCLMRNYTAANFTTFYSTRTINRVMNESQRFEDLWRILEPAPHGIVHAAFGGVGGDMAAMHSPNDPLFWFHHSNMDRMWAEWQDKDPRRLSDYSGQTVGNRRVRLSDIMDPFNVTAADAVDYRRFCYQYQPYSGNNINQTRISRQGAGSRLQAAEGMLPAPLPMDFVMMHGLDEEELRKQEEHMRQVMKQELVETSASADGETSTTSNNKNTNSDKKQSSASKKSIDKNFTLLFALLLALFCYYL